MAQRDLDVANYATGHELFMPFNGARTLRGIRDQYAPVPLATVRTVFTAMRTSFVIDQFST
jgi:hypothetical protein